MKSNTIYLICRRCMDPFYGMNPTDEAYTTREAAQRFIDKSDEEYDEYEFYIREIKIIE